MRQLVKGLAYLHQNLVIHRDLKLGNLFLTSNMQLKIGDFGLAARLDNPEDRKRTMCGTPNYIAPEILSGQRGDGHSFEVDIWSAGVVMYTLLVGRPPFETDDVKATYKRIRANQYDFPDTVHVSSSARSLIRDILRSDPGARPSLDQILKHAFVADEFVPKSIPQTALLITPPSCKPISYSSRHDHSDHFAKSTGVRVPPPPAVSERYPLQMRNETTEAQCASDPKVLQSGQLMHPTYRPDEKNGIAGLSTSSQRSLQTAVIKIAHTEAVTTLALSHCVLEAAYKSLCSFFHLQEHSRNARERLSASSSAAILVAEAQKLKQLCEEAEEILPITPANLWISQWVDYTTKYGIGYMLSNGESGVYFNDSTKIISSADGKEFEYIEREKQARYTTDDYDPAIKKKVTLLGHFKGYLVDARAENDEAEILENQLAASFVLSSRTDSSAHGGKSEEGTAQTMVFVKKWVKTRHAVLFQLSNGTIQFNFFDKSKLILSSNARVVTYLNRDGYLAAFASKMVILTSERPDLAKRLRYAKDMLQQMVRKTE